jgi:Peptidase A4 family
MLDKGWAYIVLALLVMCAGLTPWVHAGAQRQPSALIDTPIAGVSAFVLPPNFDPLTASDADLDQFGFPPRPSVEEGAEMMAHWERRAKTQTRIVPQLVQTEKFHGPVRTIKQVRTASGVIEGDNENWSGYAITDPGNPFAKPGSRVEARYVVPAPASGCESKSDTYSSANWVGIDGAFSNDVFQAGTESDLDCTSGPAYYAWIEWFPNSEIRVNNLAVSPGDLMSVAAFIGRDGRKHLSIDNLTTRKSVALAMTPPPGTTLVGNSIEWIVERPTINNAALSKLTNYVLNPWTDISGVSFPHLPGPPVIYLPDAVPASATIYRLWMTDGTDRISGVQLFSIPHGSAKNAPALWFVATTPY